MLFVWITHYFVEQFTTSNVLQDYINLCTACKNLKTKIDSVPSVKQEKGSSNPSSREEAKE